MLWMAVGAAVSQLIIWCKNTPNGLKQVDSNALGAVSYKQSLSWEPTQQLALVRVG